MLGSLHGTITVRLENRILIEVGNVGYWLFTGSWQPEGEITCYLHHHIREDMSDLYGFKTVTDLGLFEKLISISGVGPKAALALLSIGPSERVTQAIHEKDITFLSSAPGIGPKAAQKIVLELHKKLDNLSSIMGESGQTDLIAALTSLGYKEGDLYTLLQKMPPEHQELEPQIKWALQELGKK